MRFRSGAEFVAFFRRYYGPTSRAFEAAGDASELEHELVALAERFAGAEPGQPVAIPAEYLQAVAIRA
jgi:hypothetical protein